MTLLIELDTWVAAHRNALETLGDVSCRRGPVGTANASTHLAVVNGAGQIELLLWESGEAEFNYGALDSPVYEHHEVKSPEALADLLSQFLAIAIETL